MSQEDQELELMQMLGGWKNLCNMMMHDAVKLVANGKVKHYNNGSGPTEDDRLASQRWIEGGVGVVTFEDCCVMLDQDPERARKMINEWCEKPASARKVRRVRQAC